MRIASVDITNAPPVDLFKVADLSDVIVLAGRNGVGKSRLIEHIIQYLQSPPSFPMTKVSIQSTRPEEVAAWQTRELNLANPDEAGRFTQTLQDNKRRRRLTSSVVRFESNRTIQNIQPLQFTWEHLADPAEEMVGWNATFEPMRNRFSDTLHSMFRMIEAQKQGIASQALNLKRRGLSHMELKFSDPMQPFKEMFGRLLTPKELSDPSARTQTLQYTQDGQEFSIDSLSSGEREVVNIAFDFLLRSPEDCIVFFDEPELHLHPELSFRLLQALQEIGHRNQFIFATHSAEVISASLENSVVFVSPPRRDDAGEIINQALLVSESDETNQALRLLGQSVGVIALGKRIVLIEGTGSSLDKQTYGSILENRFSELTLVPSGGKHNIQSFESVHRSVLSKSLWGVDFYMLCDGDSNPGSSVETEQAKTNGLLRTLPRYHIENYFLDEDVWADAMSTIDSEEAWTRNPVEIRAAMTAIAGEFVSYAVALSVSAENRAALGNIDIMPKNCHGVSKDELLSLISEKATAEVARASTTLDSDALREQIDTKYAEILSSLNTLGDDYWKSSIPGRAIVAKLAEKFRLDAARAKRIYITAAKRREADKDDPHPSPFEEVRAIFKSFVDD